MFEWCNIGGVLEGEELFVGGTYQAPGTRVTHPCYIQSPGIKSHSGNMYSIMLEMSG